MEERIERIGEILAPTVWLLAKNDDLIQNNTSKESDKDGNDRREARKRYLCV